MNNFADIVIVNAAVWTANKLQETAEAIAISGNRIVKIGKTSEINQYIQPATKVINANGRTVLPGFIDAHLHLIEGGIYLMRADFRNCRSKEEFQETLLQYYKDNQEVNWIIGGNWNHELWGGKLPDISWIDEIIPNIPVWLTRIDGHIGLANTASLKIAGIENSSSFTNKGEIKRDKNGQLTGLFTDNAMKLITKHIPPLNQQEKIKAIKLASNYLLSYGITSVHYMPLFKPIDIDILEKLYQQKKLKQRIYTGFPIENIDELKSKKEKYRDNHFLKFGFVKAFADGSLGSQTAHMFEPYLNTDSCGLSTIDYNAFLEQTIKADKLGLQIVCHAIGDKACFDLAKSYDKLVKINGKKDRRLRVEHAQMLTSETLELMQKNEIIASMQAVHLIDEIDWAEKIIGKKRLNQAYKFKSLLNNNNKIAFGSDWFVAIPNPIWGIYAATTRSKLNYFDEIGWVPNEKISLEEALYAYTHDAAYASFDEDKKGMIKTGYLADIVILNNNIFSVTPDELKYIQTDTTILDGKIVYQRK